MTRPRASPPWREGQTRARAERGAFLYLRGGSRGVAPRLKKVPFTKLRRTAARARRGRRGAARRPPRAIPSEDVASGTAAVASRAPCRRADPSGECCAISVPRGRSAGDRPRVSRKSRRESRNEQRMNAPPFFTQCVGARGGLGARRVFPLHRCSRRRRATMTALRATTAARTWRRSRALRVKRRRSSRTCSSPRMRRMPRSSSTDTPSARTRCSTSSTCDARARATLD
jgi:hypothetical protein